MILQRTTEAPKHKRDEVQRRYPGYKVIGDRMGWFYPVEQTKVVLMSIGWPSLVKDVREHLRGNDLPVPPNLSEVMQAWWCSEMGGEACGEPPPVLKTDLRAMAERFLRTAKSYIFDGGERVGQEEVERRASICATCPYNVPSDSFCSGCFMTSLTASAMKLVSGWKTSQDDRLKACGICSCELKIKVFIPTKHMQYRELKDDWPEHCWNRPEPKEAL